MKTYINDINIFNTLDFVKGVLSNMKPIAFILVLKFFFGEFSLCRVAVEKEGILNKK